MNESKLPLGLCKQAIMKLESAMCDLKEIAEDDEVNESDKDDFNSLSEVISNVIAKVTIKVMREMDEEEFLREEIDMDALEEYPEVINDLLDEEI